MALGEHPWEWARNIGTPWEELRARNIGTRRTELRQHARGRSPLTPAKVAVQRIDTVQEGVPLLKSSGPVLAVHQTQFVVQTCG